MLRVMFSRELLADLLRYTEWADAKVWAALPETVPPDTRLFDLLLHIHVVQRAFLTVWTAGDVRAAYRRAEDFPSLPDLREWARAYYPQAHALIRDVSDERLLERVQLPWARQVAQRLGGVPGETTMGETCFQVASHSTYHRGQVNARLREIGAEPPLVDYIWWVWLGRPSAEWKT